MTVPLQRARSRGPVTILTLAGILLLPAVLGGLLVTALYNPTERLDRMTAAIVNLDEPVTIDGQYTPLGRVLAAGLVEGSDELDSNLSWVISNETDAEDGLDDGSYQAVVTIPANFSAAATSSGQALGGAELTPQQAKIVVTTPDDARMADDLITTQIAQVAASTMSELLSEQTLTALLSGFGTMGGELDAAADGATQLADGAQELRSGAAKLSGGLTTLAGHAYEAARGAQSLGQGLTQGASELETAGIVPTELRQAANGAAAATAGVAEGLTPLIQGLSGLAANCPESAGAEFCAQLTSLSQGANQLTTPAAQAAQAAAGTKQGLSQLATQAPVTIAKQLREAGAAASTLGTGLRELAEGAEKSATGASELSAGANALSNGVSELADGLGSAVDSVPSFTDNESTSLASVITVPVTASAGGTALFGASAIPLLATVVLWFGGLATFVALRATMKNAVTSRHSSFSLTWRAFWPAALIGIGQAVLVTAVVQGVVRYDVSGFGGFLGLAVLASVAFAAVNQALVAALGGAGRWISTIVGVLALATGIVSTVPAWLLAVAAWLPTAPAFAGLVQPAWAPAIALAVWTVGAFLAAMLVTALRRRTAARSALVTAV